MELLDRRIRDEEEALAILPLPVLARVPLLRRHLGRLRENEAWTVPPAIREACRTLLLQLPPPRPGGRAHDHGHECLDGRRQDHVRDQPRRHDGRRRPAGHPARPRPEEGRRRRIASVAQPVHLNELLSPELDLYPLLRTPASLPSVSVLATELQQGDAILLDRALRAPPPARRRGAREADQVIIDTPPLGEISDALRLLDYVDECSSSSGPATRTAWGSPLRRTCSRAPRTEPAGFLVVGGTPGPRAATTPTAGAASCSWKTSPCRGGPRESPN